MKTVRQINFIYITFQFIDVKNSAKNSMYWTIAEVVSMIALAIF
jgi:hypothetical protein